MEPLIYQKIRQEVPNEKQRAFFLASGRHIAYGGARGGGKSWAMRRKLILLALRYDGLKLLLLRRTLPELRENHLLPMLEELTGLARYSEVQNAIVFPNGSPIKLGYSDQDTDIYQYQGQEYDVIGLEEATHFTLTQRTFLLTALRSTRQDCAPRMYYTANPGGIGHAWFKRLFIDRLYTEGEEEADYAFIPASLWDNKILMERDPGYLKMLETLPEPLKRAQLYGDWDVFAGQYFTEFDRGLHVLAPFAIPQDWQRYIALDYGLDMTAAYWIAVDIHGFAYVYRELYQPDLIISQAAQKLVQMTGEEPICRTLAPPDLWNRRQDSGQSAAELFAREGLPLSMASNDRIQGWYNLHEWLTPCLDPFGQPAARLRIFQTCRHLIRTLPQLSHDETNPNDVSRTPHELTHAPDAIRYFVSGRPKGKKRTPIAPPVFFDSLRPKKDVLGKGSREEVW